MQPSVLIVGDGAIGLTMAHILQPYYSVTVLSRKRHQKQAISLHWQQYSSVTADINFEIHEPTRAYPHPIVLFCLKYYDLLNFKPLRFQYENSLIINFSNVPLAEQHLSRYYSNHTVSHALITTQSNLYGNQLLCLSDTVHLEFKQTPMLADISQTLSQHSMVSAYVHGEIAFAQATLIKALTTLFAHFNYLEGTTVQNISCNDLIAEVNNKQYVYLAVCNNLRALRADFIPSGIKDYLYKEVNELIYIFKYLESIQAFNKSSIIYQDLQTVFSSKG